MPFEGVTIGSARLIRGDCRDVLTALSAESVHCCVTSPPYFGLRDYGVEGQIGLEPTPDAYIANLVEIMRGVRRVLRSDGTLWLNIGDSYASGGNGWRPGNPAKNGGNSNRDGVRAPGFKAKDLIGIPWMLAFALRDDGWYLRRDIIWHKPNPMPESVTDRPTSAHEYLFLLSKSARYFYDSDAIKEPCKDPHDDNRRMRQSWEKRQQHKKTSISAFYTQSEAPRVSTGKRNARSVWTIATAPFRGAHFATFPPALVEPCILAGTSECGVCPKCGAPWARVVRKSTNNDARHVIGIPGEGQNRGQPASRCGDPNSETIGWRQTCSCKANGIVRPTVIDPFGGAATTALTASKLGRSGISIELSAAYHDIACERIAAIQKAEAA